MLLKHPTEVKDTVPHTHNSSIKIENKDRDVKRILL